MSTANKIMLVNNRVERAKSFLLSQFKDKPNINALVDALVSELQELENTVNQIQTVRTLEGAYGWWLDRIGEELDISRGNYADNDYKTAIKIAMAKQSASASVDDILRIVSLITGDNTAELRNDSHYLLELYSWLFCVADSYDGLNSLGQLFPLNTRVRMVKHDSKPFTLNKAGYGFGDNTTLCSLVYSKVGHANDPRFVTIPTQDIPPAITSAPTIKSACYIYGKSVAGSVLTLTLGTYEGDNPLTITKQWLLNGVNISGATDNTYTVVAGDAGKAIQCKVTVTNAYGSVIDYSNNIAIDVVVPPVNPLTSTLGVRDHSVITTNTGSGSVSANAGIEITKDGTIRYLANNALEETLNWASTPTVGVGNDYTFVYRVVNGRELTGLNQNAPKVMSSNTLLSLSVSSVWGNVVSGTYDFTIYKTSDNTVISTKRIYISAEVIGNN